MEDMIAALPPGEDPLVALFESLSPSTSDFSYAYGSGAPGAALVSLIRAFAGKVPLRDPDALLEAYLSTPVSTSLRDRMGAKRWDASDPQPCAWPVSRDGPWPPWTRVEPLRDGRPPVSPWFSAEAPMAWLVAHGADPFKPNKNYANVDASCPFEVAMSLGWAGVVIQALHHPSRPSADALAAMRSPMLDDGGKNRLPWLHALMSHDRLVEAAAWLDVPGADVLQTDAAGRTAMHYVASPQAVAMLASRGVPADVTDTNGLTPAETWVELAANDNYTGKKVDNAQDLEEMMGAMARAAPATQDNEDMPRFVACLASAHRAQFRADLMQELADRTVSRPLPDGTMAQWGIVAYMAVEIQRAGRGISAWKQRDSAQAMYDFLEKNPSSGAHDTVPGLPDRALALAWLSLLRAYIWRPTGAADIFSPVGATGDLRRRGLFQMLHHTTGTARAAVARTLVNDFISDPLTVRTAPMLQLAMRTAFEIFSSGFVVAKNTVRDRWPTFSPLKPDHVAAIVSIGQPAITTIMAGLLGGIPAHAKVSVAQASIARKVADMIACGIKPDIASQDGVRIMKILECLGTTIPEVDKAHASLLAEDLSRKHRAAPARPRSGARHHGM